MIAYAGQTNEIGFFLSGEDGAGLSTPTDRIVLRYVIGGDIVSSDRIRSVGLGFYVAELELPAHAQGKIMVEAKAPGALIWRDIVDVLPLPSNGPGSPTEPPVAPQPPPEQSLGAEELNSEWAFYDNTKAGSLLSQSPRSFRPQFRRSGSNQQVYTVLDLENGEYMLSGKMASLYNSGALIHIHEHGSPYRSVIGDPCSASAAFNERIVIHKPDASAMLRLRFQFDGQFSGSEQYSVTELSLKRVIGHIATKGGVIN